MDRAQYQMKRAALQQRMEEKRAQLTSIYQKESNSFSRYAWPLTKWLITGVITGRKGLVPALAAGAAMKLVPPILQKKILNGFVK